MRMRFINRSLGCRLAVLGAAAGMMLASSRSGMASGTVVEERNVLAYDVTAPVTGYNLTAGTTAQIRWQGGDPLVPVNVLLIDTDQWAVVQQIALGITDDGQEYWAIPSDLDPGDYQIYVEDVNQTAWTYGTPFTVS